MVERISCNSEMKLHPVCSIAMPFSPRVPTASRRKCTALPRASRPGYSAFFRVTLTFCCFCSGFQPCLSPWPWLSSAVSLMSLLLFSLSLSLPSRLIPIPFFPVWLQQSQSQEEACCSLFSGPQASSLPPSCNSFLMPGFSVARKPSGGKTVFSTH